MQVVGVSQYQGSIKLGELVGSQGLNRGLRANWREDWCFKDTMRGGKSACPGVSLACLDLEAEWGIGHSR